MKPLFFVPFPLVTATAPSFLSSHTVGCQQTCTWQKNRTPLWEKILTLGISQEEAQLNGPTMKTTVNKPHEHVQFLINFQWTTCGLSKQPVQLRCSENERCFSIHKRRAWCYVKNKTFRDQRNKLLEMKVMIADMKGV